MVLIKIGPRRSVIHILKALFIPAVWLWTRVVLLVHREHSKVRLITQCSKNLAFLCSSQTCRRNVVVCSVVSRLSQSFEWHAAWSLLSKSSQCQPHFFLGNTYMSHNPFRKHFLGHGVRERSRGPHSVHDRTSVPHGKSDHHPTIPGLCQMRWRSLGLFEAQSAVSFIDKKEHPWLQHAFCIKEGNLLVGTRQVQCVELDVEGSWEPTSPLCSAVPAKIQPQWDSVSFLRQLPSKATPTSGLYRLSWKRKAERRQVKHKCSSVRWR